MPDLFIADHAPAEQIARGRYRRDAGVNEFRKLEGNLFHRAPGHSSELHRGNRLAVQLEMPATVVLVHQTEYVDPEAACR